MYAGLLSIVLLPSSVSVRTFWAIRGLIFFCSFAISSASVPDVPSTLIEIAGLEFDV